MGQALVEWVNIVTNGANCGWNFYEGDKKWTNALPSGFVLTPPLIEYGHTNGRTCIIGGIVYRGSQIPQLYGAYLYSDYGSGEIWALRYSGSNVLENSTFLTNASAHATAFGVDPANGDALCAAARGGTNSTIERIVFNNPSSPVPRITHIVWSDTNLLIQGTNGTPNHTYYLLASTNIAEPLTDWAAVATSLFDAGGNFAVTNSVDPVLPQRFYRVQVP